MRAAVLAEDRPRLELVELDTPVPAEGEVLVRVTGCGICGSDLHLASQLAAPGTVLGHEIAGEVAELGPGVDAGLWRVGTPVAVRPFAGCGTCASCRSGRADHCATFQLLGMQRPGGFAELVAAQADELFTLPAAVAADEQPLVEPLAIVRHALRRGDVGPADRVAVLGGGPIGLATVAWARALGIATIAVSEPSALRRDLARRLGATAALDPSGGDVAAALAEAVGGPPTVVVECSGRPGLLEEAIELAAVDARVVVVGICPDYDRIFPLWAIGKELDLRFSVYYGRDDFTETVTALDAHRLEVLPMVTETVGLEALPERFGRLERDADAGKVLVRP